MHDFVAIGETDTDVFIRLEDESGAQLSGMPDALDYRMSLPFAAKIPYESATIISGVGNAPNAAVSAARLGLRSALFAHVGDDEGGRNTIESLKEHGVDTSLVTPEAGKKTSHSYILWYKQDRTILRRHENFSYTLPDLGSPKWAYFSAMGSKADDFYNHFADYIEQHPQVKFAFQPGGNEIGLGTRLGRFYKRCDIFFSNVEEAGQILGIQTLGISELLKRVQALGPKIVVITDGPRGAYAFDGTNTYPQLPYPDPKPPFERTGAGDAFASTVVAALALGQDLPTALQWGAVNSMSVVQQVGAQKGLLTREKIEEYLKSAPAEFETKKL
ncbi:carbohydrate kinase family protein [Candidatus Parcubacteria bacterium]|nr:carbohydrate kinase family protein [Candidatus Parcubacteria bacterium]